MDPTLRFAMSWKSVFPGEREDQTRTEFEFENIRKLPLADEVNVFFTGFDMQHANAFVK